MNYTNIFLRALLPAALFAASCSTATVDTRPSSKDITDSSTIVIKDVRKVTAYFNAAKYIVRQTEFSWNPDGLGWIFAQSFSNSYNNKGQLIAKETNMPDAFDFSKITPLERDSFEYTPHGDTSSLVRCIYSPASDKWINVSKWTYIYQGHRRTEETALSWDISSSKYHTVYNRTFEYNSDGNISRFTTITPDREDTATKHISECIIEYDENGFETGRTTNAK